jgi:hypothetical protein
MSRKRHKPEETVAKLRQVDVLTAQFRPVAEAIRAIGVTEVSSATSCSTARSSPRSRRLASSSRVGGVTSTGASGYHFPLWPQRWQDQPMPSTRAAVAPTRKPPVELAPGKGRPRRRDRLPLAPRPLDHGGMEPEAAHHPLGASGS